MRGFPLNAVILQFRTLFVKSLAMQYMIIEKFHEGKSKDLIPAF